jgi:hypothetical protein
VTGYVLVGGWPAAGKTTVATALAARVGLPYLAKDEVKEALMDALGAPSTVAASRALGVAAVHAVLRTARGCPGAVIDSTWLWGQEVPPLGVGPVIEVDTARAVDIGALADAVRAALDGRTAAAVPPPRGACSPSARDA